MASVPADSSGAGAPGFDIEITPAMVKAGVSAFEEFYGSYGLEQVLRAVYSAMDRASPE